LTEMTEGIESGFDILIAIGTIRPNLLATIVGV